MGKISVVGIGPGSLDDMTYRARRTIEEATTVVGYKRYIELIAELVEGKQVLDTGMTQEIDRCRAALKAASDGETVVVISSGDAGIYGMAGLVLELLVKMGEKVKVGAPLVKFDRDVIHAAGYQDTVIMAVTNSGEYPLMKKTTGMDAKAGETTVLTF